MRGSRSSQLNISIINVSLYILFLNKIPKLHITNGFSMHVEKAMFVLKQYFLLNMLDAGKIGDRKFGTYLECVLYEVNTTDYVQRCTHDI